MPQNQQVNLKFKGLYTAPNDFSGVPDGALDVADNIVIDNENLPESRRGFALLDGVLPSSGDRIWSWASYQGKKIIWYGSSLSTADSLAYYSAGYNTYSGTFTNPDALLSRVRFYQGNQNLYISTGSGVQKLDAYNATPTMAGVPKGLDLQVSLTGSSGFLEPNDVVTVTATTTSGSANLTVISATSDITTGQYIRGTGITAGTTVSSITQSSTVSTGNVTTAIGSTTISAINSTTGFEATLVAGQFITAVTGITNGARIVSVNTGAHTAVISIAATAAGTVAATIASDTVVTMSANATASGTVSLTFSTGSQVGYRILFGIRDANNNLIYGAPSQFNTVTNNTGATRDVSVVFTIPSGITTAHFYQVYRTAQTADAAIIPFDNEQLVYEGNPTAPDLANGYITVTDSTPDTLRGLALYTSIDQEGITQENDQPPYCKDFCAFRNFGIYANTKSKQQRLLTILAVGGTSGIALDDTITIAGVVFTAKSSETVVSGYYKLFTSGTPSQNIADTTNSLIKVVNRYASNTATYAFLESLPDGLPGQILLEERVYGGSSFAVVASAHGSAFSPALPTSGTTVSSSQSINKNGIMISKDGQYESVPGANLIFAGDSSQEILRVIPLREYVVVLKQDGIYRLTGTTVSSMTIAPFDLTSRLLAPETARALSNEVWGFFDQGICSVSDTGVSVRSRPIENVLRNLVGSSLSTIRTIAFGVSYETDRKYILALPGGSGDDACRNEYVFNIFTNTWVRWTRDCTSGLVLQDEDKLYFGNDDNTASLERKTNTYRDYVDEEFAVNIVSFSGLSVVLTSVSGVSVGDVLQESSTVFSVITAVDVLTNTILVENEITWVLGAAEVFPAIENVIQWKPVIAGNPAFVRQYSEGVLVFKRTRFNTATISFYSDVSGSFEATPLIGTTTPGWGLFAWGQSPWGGVVRPSSLRFLVPQNKQMCSQLTGKLTIKNGYSNWAGEGISLSFNEVSQEVS